MLEGRKRLDEYARSQIRNLLSDLKNAKHSAKLQAIKKFQTYLTDYEPEITEDSADFLFWGGFAGDFDAGLIYWSGIESEKHSGQLKRICGPVISLILWLISLEATDQFGNVFYERFIHIPVQYLVKMNLPRHILKPGEGKKTYAMSADARGGNAEDAFELIAVLLNDHRTMDGDDEPVDLSVLLKNSTLCVDKFLEWNQMNKSAHITSTMAQYKEAKQKILNAENRPVKWEQVNFRLVPQQEGEDYLNELPEEEEVIPPIPDPLGLNADIDLRSIQTQWTSGRKSMAAPDMRRSIINGSSFRLKSKDEGALGNQSFLRNGSGIDLGDEEEEEDEDEDDDEDEELMMMNHELAVVKPVGRNQRAIRTSVIPSDKSFSTSMFLSVVHGGVSFDKLTIGLNNLKELLQQQSSRRENLVRTHFGLFVQCAEGLEWMKAYRKGTVTLTRRSSFVQGPVEEKYVRSQYKIEKGEERLKNAQASLELAKKEAKSTLAPILERMKQQRRIKSAEKVLKRVAAILEHPYRMRLALGRNDLQEVINIYQRVQAIPGSSSIRILERVKESAEKVITELRKRCTSNLLVPNSNFSALLKYGKIIQQLDGEGPYIQVMRSTLICQCLEFIRLLKEQRDAFLKDAVDHYNKGVELNVLRKSALTAIVKKNNVDTHNSSNSRMQSSSDSTNNIRNASTNNRANLTLKKPVLPRGSGEGAKLAGLGSNSTFGNDDMSTRKINRKKSLRRVASTRLMSMSNLHGAIPNNDFNDIVEENLFETVEDNINNETDEVNFSFYYKTTDEFEFDDDISEYDLEAEEEFLLELQEDATDAMVNNKNSGGNSSGPTTNRGVEAFLGVGKYVNSVSKTPTTNVTTADTTKTGKGSEYDFDYTTKLSALVRLNYVESVVDLVAKWFPCLFRLVTELSTYQQTENRRRESSTDRNPKTLFRVDSQFISRHGSQQTPPARMLGSVLNLCAETLNQIINGITPTFSKFNISTELQSALLEQPNLSSKLLASVKQDHSKAHIVVKTEVYKKPLTERYLRSALMMIFDLYDALDSIINANHAAIVDGDPETKDSKESTTDKTAIPFQNVTTRGRSITNDDGPPEYDPLLVNRPSISVTSPYFEAMSVLKSLAYEGETAGIRRVMDRLLLLSYHLSDLDHRKGQGRSHKRLKGHHNLALMEEKQSVMNSSTQSIRSGFTGLDGNNNTSQKIELDLPNQLAPYKAADGYNGGVDTQFNRQKIAADPNGKRRTRIENIVLDLEALIFRCLEKLVIKSKRHGWSATIVHEGIIKVFQSFLESLRREAILIDDSNSELFRMNTDMDSSLTSNSQRRLKERNSISNTFLLHTLDDELKFSETNDRLKQEMLLDLVRASVRFRTRTLLKVWHAVCKEFPRDNGSHYKNGSIPFVVKLSDHANGEKGTLMSKLFGTEPVQVKAPFQSFNTFEDEFQQSNDSEFDQTETTDGENRAFRDRLEDTIPFYDDALKNIVSENILIEESAYSAYLEQKIFSIRSSIISGYSLFVLKDMSGTMPTRDSFHSDSFGVPTHLSRILLMIGQERVILRKELGRLGVELGFIRRPENKIANVNKDDPTTESGGNTSRKNSFSGTSFIYTHHHRKDTSNTASLGTNFDNFSFNNNASSHINASEAAYDENDPDDYDSIIADSVMTQMQAIQHQLYSDFLFREICNSFMDVYGELIGKIVCNSLMEMTGSSATVPSRGIRKSGAIDSFSMRSPIKDAVGGSHGLFVPTAVGVGSIPYSDTVTPVALGQAIEEYEFLKIIMARVLPKRSPHLQHKLPSLSGVSKFYPSTMTLLKEARLFAMIISDAEHS